MSDFNGVGAIVTGGTGGIGAATAALLRERGARVAVLDLRTDNAPAGVHAVLCDLTDAAAVDEAVATAVGLLGSLDVLVNNAGIGAVGDIAGNDDAEWARVLDVNVTGIARVTRARPPPPAPLAAPGDRQHLLGRRLRRRAAARARHRDAGPMAPSCPATAPRGLRAPASSARRRSEDEQ